MSPHPMKSATTLILLTGLLMSVVSAQADPIRWSQQGWTTDFSKSNVDMARILSGGPPKDGIPSIDNPVFSFAPDTDLKLAPHDPVVSLEIGEDARAYPLEILTWHEIVNDVVDGVPVAVTYCPLCNSAPVFDRRMNGQWLEFGTTGKLKDSNLIMYDRKTESWWQQFTGEAIVGEFTGQKLDLIPARLESWADFKSRHPNGRVLVPNDTGFRDYGRNPYIGYDTTTRPFLYDGQLPEGIDPMERVVIVPRPDGEDTPLVIRMAAISEAGSLTQAGHEFTWQEGRRSALDKSRITQGRDVGSVTVRRNGDLVPYDVTFAFVAHAFHPKVTIVGF